MWHLKTVTIGALLAAVVVAGCGSSSGSSSSSGASTASQSANPSGSTTASGKPAKVAYITYDYADYQQAEQSGLKAAVSPGGGSVTLFNANFDPQALQQQCKDAVSSGRYNVIVLSPVTPPTGVPCVVAAKAAGIPVVAMEGAVGTNPNDINPQVPGVVGSVGTTDIRGARDMAKAVQEGCAGKNPCNVITDTIPGDPLGEMVLTALKAVPGVKIVDNINSNYDTSKMHSIAPDAFAAHPNTDALVTFDDAVSLATVPAIKAAGLTGKVKLFAAGGSRQGAKAVADGVMFAVLGTWPYREGKVAGEMAVKAANGQPISPAGVDAQNLGKPEIVTKATVSEFQPEWGPA
jgi:ribose transport system substrate-binding protein